MLCAYAGRLFRCLPKLLVQVFALLALRKHGHLQQVMLRISRPACMLSQLFAQAKTLMHLADTRACLQGQAQDCFMSAQPASLLIGSGVFHPCQ